MNTIQSVPVRFDIKILENDGIELAKLLPQLAEHGEKIQEYIGSVYQEDPSFSQESNKKIFGVFNTSLMELMKITNVIKDRIIDIHYKMGLSDKYKIVVAYDVSNKLPQAIALVLLDREDVKGRKSIELYSLITSVWNLNCPKNINHPNRVKGAGSSIIEFCKKLGIEYKAKYLYLVGAPGALSFYDAHGFKRVCPELIDNRFGEDLFANKRTPMFFDLEESNKKTTSPLPTSSKSNNTK